MAEWIEDPLLEATAAKLADLDPRLDAGGWTRRARDQVWTRPAFMDEPAMREYLEGRLERSTALAELREQVRSFKSKTFVPDEATRPGRQIVERAGGLTNPYVQSLGYEDLEHFYGYDKEGS